jgi:hypothetical protein
MQYVLLALVLPTAAAQGTAKDAEKLYRDLEKRLVAAKNVRASFTAKVAGTPVGDVEVKGSLELSEGNKARLELKALVKDKEEIARADSDGKTLRVAPSASAKPRELPVPEDFGKNMRIAISRGGVLAAQSVTEKPDLGKEGKTIDEKGDP